MTRTAILLVNLGTPESPRPRDVYRYLIEFLTDKRVIDLSFLKRQLLVRGVIVPKRFWESARQYQNIWTSRGSPLMIYSQEVAALLQKALGDSFQVELAMRYQNPSIPAVLEKMQDADQIIVLPLFPQYASATTGSIYQKVMKTLSKWDVIPKLSFVNAYPDHPKMIEAICSLGKEAGALRAKSVLFSFHGLPKRQILKGNRTGGCLKEGCCKNPINWRCYAAQCHATARAIADGLGLSSYSVAFQSRLGKEPWLSPNTSDVLQKLNHEGIKSVAVFCPSFVCDCLETLYEIGVEYAAAFKGELLLVPSLNTHPLWIETLKEIAYRHAVCYTRGQDETTQYRPAHRREKEKAR